MSGTYLSGIHSTEGRRALAEAVLALFRQWGVEEGQQAELLGLSEVNGLWGGGALPNDTEVLERAGLLLAIDRVLKQRYADEPLMRDRWVEFPNVSLDGKTPLDAMLEGMAGIRRVNTVVEQQLQPPMD